MNLHRAKDGEEKSLPILQPRMHCGARWLELWTPATQVYFCDSTSSVSHCLANTVSRNEQQMKCLTQGTVFAALTEREWNKTKTLMFLKQLQVPSWVQRVPPHSCYFDYLLSEAKTTLFKSLQWHPELPLSLWSCEEGMCLWARLLTQEQGVLLNG